MRSHQIKIERPNLKGAHEFYKRGYFGIGPENYFGGEQRRKEIEEIFDNLGSVVKQHFPRTQNLEYAILKANLIIEHAITQYIRAFSYTYVGNADVRFGFSQKMEIAYLTGFGAYDPILLPTVERLNAIRNQVAHRFTIDRSAFDELLRINSDDYDEFKVEDDRQRISMLRNICRGVCGMISGLIVGAYFVSEDENRSKNPK